MTVMRKKIAEHMVLTGAPRRTSIRCSSSIS